MFKSLRFRASIAIVIFFTSLVLVVRLIQIYYTWGIVFSTVDQHMRNRIIFLKTAVDLFAKNTPDFTEDSKRQSKLWELGKHFPEQFFECKIQNYPFVFFGGIQSKNGAIFLGQNIPGNTPWKTIDFVHDKDFWTGKIGDGNFRIVYEELSPGDFLFVGASSDTIVKPLLFFLSMNIVFGLLIIGLATISVWIIFGQIFKPLINISKIAERIRKGQIKSRIPIHEIDTELTQVGLSLNAMLERLENTIEAHARFNSEVSHELLAPLNQITMLLCEMSGNDPDSVALRKKIVECQGAVEKTRNLACDLLELAKSESPSSHSHSIIDLEPVIYQVVIDVEHLAAEKEIQIELESSTAGVVANPIQLYQVFFNILTNAIKFAPKSSVIIGSMKTTNVDVRISIQDQGPGVFPGEVGNLFKRFFRAKSARNHEKLGYGLGLAICKNIIDHHSGSIGYERTPEAGTTFFVILPIGPKLPED